MLRSIKRPTRVSSPCRRRTDDSCAYWSPTRGAKSVLEIGAASGYSGIWLGLGARESGGRVVAIEYDPRRAKEAAANIRAAGLDDVVEVVHGDAFAEIPRLPGTFDLVFLDAWKPDYKKFFDLVFPRLDAGRRLRGAQRRQQEERDGAVSPDYSDAPPALHDDRLALARRHVGVVQDEVKPVHIIGVPLDLGAGRRGVDMGPSAFRIAGIGDQIAALGRTVVDKGDLPAPIPETQRPADARKKYVREIAQVCQRLRDSALKSLDAGALPLVLGGDHSLAAGSVAASAEWVRRSASLPLGLIWVDAHGDMNTPETTTSGNVHGMPLAALLGHEPRSWRQSALSPSVHTGAHGAPGRPQSRRAGEGAHPRGRACTSSR